MSDVRPVLIVDAGGTLVTRTRPGLATRVVTAVRAAGDTARPEGEVRAAVLTAATADDCLRALEPLAPAARAAVATALAEDPGEAIVLPGAEELLRVAVARDWRVIVATNAGPGTPPLPDALGRRVSAVVESRAYGLVKEDPRFWQRLLGEEDVDPRLALVVGDSTLADSRTPESVGLQSRLVGATGTELAVLTAELWVAGPRPGDAVAVVGGSRATWAGQEVAAAPHLRTIVTRVTRAQIPFTAGTASGTVSVVRRRLLPPAITLGEHPPPGVFWAFPPRARRPYRMPAGLESTLQREGLSIDVLSPSEQRHAISMIREARSAEAAASRTADLVLFLTERKKQDDR